MTRRDSGCVDLGTPGAPVLPNTGCWQGCSSNCYPTEGIIPPSPPLLLPHPPPHSTPPCAYSRSRCCGGCSGIENNFIAVRNMKGSALGNTLYAEYETGAPGQSWTRMKV
eukprot:COSAG01_NODE_332_length_18712_cov_41.424358_21_plen_110_part_00